MPSARTISRLSCFISTALALFFLGFAFWNAFTLHWVVISTALVFGALFALAALTHLND